jgi:hypothetical protein
MFVIPAGMILGAPISVSQFLFWNLIPVTIGNLIAGALFTGIALYITYPSEQPQVASSAPVVLAAESEQQAAFARAAGVH